MCVGSDRRGDEPHFLGYQPLHLPFEDKGELAEQVVALRERMIERQDQLLTSAVTLGEVLVKPMQAGDDELTRQYERAINAGAAVLSFDQAAASAFAALRRNRSIRQPDAIQLAWPPWPAWICSSPTTSEQRLRPRVTMAPTLLGVASAVADLAYALPVVEMDRKSAPRGDSHR